MRRILILGGTGDAAALATELARWPDVEVISSLAGRTQIPAIPDGTTRIGGFGGLAGLTAYLHQQQISHLIDATHPFAAQISWTAAEAAQAVGVARLMLVRPAWEKMPEDDWTEVESHAAAAAVLPGLADRVFLTIGRQELGAFAHLTQIWFLMRMIDPPLPDAARPPGQLLLERGPFRLPDELALLSQHQIAAIVSKNSGGAATYAKIQAARKLGLPVVMVQPPPMPAGDRVSEIADALAWIQGQSLG